MGAVCCCMRPEDFEDYVNPNSSVYRNCLCFRCFVQNFLNAYTLLLQRGQTHHITSSIQGTSSLTFTSSVGDSLSDMYRSPPRPMPYDADPRRFRLQRDGLVSRREKGTSHSHEESEPLRRSDTDAGTESLVAGTTGDKLNGATCEEGSKENIVKSYLKQSSTKSAESWRMYTSSDDEDVCPTCLEEYTSEDPKITTKCGHHYHLACIYEWMERSENCPVCGKMMDFDETP